MGKLDVGMAPQSSGSQLFLKAEKTGTVVFLITGTDRYFSTNKQFSVFEKNGGPCNATWITVGKNDPGFELGLKGDGYAVWVPVAVNVAGPKETPSWEVRIWQTNKTIHQALVNTESDTELVGMRIKISMTNNRWGFMNLGPNAKNPGPSEEEIEALVAEIPDDDTFGDLVSKPSTPADVKEFLMKKLNVANWNAVRSAFKLDTVATDDMEVEDA